MVGLQNCSSFANLGLYVGLCGFANVLQCAWAVEVTNPNAPSKAQSEWQKKLKPFGSGFKVPKSYLFFLIITFPVSLKCRSSGFLGLLLTVQR